MNKLVNNIDVYLMVFGSLVVALIPTELFLLGYWFLSPVTFIQKFVTIMGSVFVLGGFQAVLGFVWLRFLAEIFS